ncbi:RING-H2 finger protein ATL19 [Spatholobus suberectus]|nr:RING-H2 finger protein ATL19 [Spatholobus suberectus]
MAEFTELFPLGQQLDGLMHMYMFVITFDLPTLVIVVFIFTVLFFILYQILNGLFYWVIEMRPNERDLEEGIAHLANYGASEPSHQVTIFHALVHSNLQAWTFVTAFEGIFDEKRGQKLRASKKLPPLVNYGMHGVTRSCDDCAICLEEFQVKDMMQPRLCSSSYLAVASWPSAKAITRSSLFKNLI